MLLGGLGIFAFSLRHTNLNQLGVDLAYLRWGWFAVAIGCIVLYLGLEGVVVKIFMADRYPTFTWKNAFRLPLIEQLFNGLTPFSTGVNQRNWWQCCRRGSKGEWPVRFS